MKLRNLKFLIINLILLFPLTDSQDILASTNSTKPTQEYLRNKPQSNFYILGPGDFLSIVVNENTEELNVKFSVNGEGLAKLRRLDDIYVAGLTIGELTDLLNKEYERFVKEPNVKLSIISYRPVKVYVEGEVESPGLHVLPGSSSPLDSSQYSKFQNNNFTPESLVGLLNEDRPSPKKNEENLTNNIYFPSLFDVIKKSEGVSVYADLENVQITRVNNISNGGGKLAATVNLLETLTLKDVNQNIRIYDGDTIKIPRVDNPTTEQISAAIKSNINPKFIKVGVAGRVLNPGQLTMNKRSTLNDALIFSGGLKTTKGPIVFIRYDNNGKMDRRTFRYSKSAKSGSYKNPYLNNGDLIVVTSGILSQTNDIIQEITNPLTGIKKSYEAIKLFTD